MTEGSLDVPTRPRPVEPVRVTVFHTNDMRGHLQAMARLSHYVGRLRLEAEGEGRRVYFWDAGDACDPSGLEAAARVLDAMGYNLQVLGDHLLATGGVEAVSDLCLRVEFPILAANVVDSDGRLPEGLRPSVRIPYSGRRTMGVLGLVTPAGLAAEGPGVRLLDPVDVARDLVGRMKSQGVAPVVVLSHLGLELDRRLVDVVPGIDLVVGGHSHERLPAGEARGAALIVHAGPDAEVLGRVDLTLDGVSGSVIEHQACLLLVPQDEPADEAVIEAGREGG
ncbi:MAG: hypothetical protein AB1449_02505 [Chloroflexota bacterium]